MILQAYENVDVNAVSADGVSALLLAAHEGFTDVVVALLDTGNCDLSIAYPGGVTALHFAVANGHAAIAKALLLGEGCTPESDGGKFKPQTETQKLVRDKTGDTILHAVRSVAMHRSACFSDLFWSGGEVVIFSM